jgi:hypothetical protein
MVSFGCIEVESGAIHLDHKQLECDSSKISQFSQNHNQREYVYAQQLWNGVQCIKNNLNGW